MTWRLHDHRRDANALDVQGLLDAARDKTGLSDYGDEWFVEPLTVLTKALADEAKLSEMGLALTKSRFIAPGGPPAPQAAADRAPRDPRRGRDGRRRDLRAAAYGIHAPAPAPASSPELTSTLSWETSYPLPFPGESPDAEIRKKRARDRYEMFLEMAPDFGDIHTIEWTAPKRTSSSWTVRSRR